MSISKSGNTCQYLCGGKLRWQSLDNRISTFYYNTLYVCFYSTKAIDIIRKLNLTRDHT